MERQQFGRDRLQPVPGHGVWRPIHKIEFIDLVRHKLYRFDDPVGYDLLLRQHLHQFRQRGKFVFERSVGFDSVTAIL